MKKLFFPLILAILMVFIFPLSFALAVDKNAQGEGQQTRRHPTYTLRGMEPPQTPESSINPNFVVTPESRIAEESVWKSSYIPERLIGLDLGDVDNDGLNELAYVTLARVYLARYTGGTYFLLATYVLPANSRPISLDLFDTDGDGKKEIIISAQNDNDHSANSMILGYSGGQELTVLAKGLRYYLRVIGPEKNKMLVGQQSGITNGEAYSGPVHYANFIDGKISLSGKVPLPRMVDVFNFNLGVMGTEHMDLVSYIKFPTEHLVLTDSGGGKVWESHDEYGGSINYIDRLPYGDTGKNLEYLPTRIILADIDEDGVNELIVAKNNLGSTRLFKNLRSFNSGTIEARKLVNLSLIPFFNSGSLLPGPAMDYQLGDFDNNGTKDLVVGILIEPGSGMMKDARSIIFSYNNLYVTQPTAPSTGSQAPK
ncbi:MAG: VCBS repeat-containing protein [Deltaproteobacteria bacterium]|jgi:hypothetical protein|nr:VCBS repeat-containing protein [Deltaproteobacteria bacterium]